jgi:hypothetical protein
MKGEVEFGHWGDHVIGWWHQRKRPNVLYLFFEELKQVETISHLHMSFTSLSHAIFFTFLVSLGLGRLNHENCSLFGC